MTWISTKVTTMTKWHDNAIQFTRLLAEIAANCELTDAMYDALCESMALQRSDIDELFGRAQVQFEEIKAGESEETRNSNFSQAVFQIQVVSDDKDFYPGRWDIEDIIREMNQGDLVGDTQLVAHHRLTPRAAAEKLTDLGSTPDFFDLDMLVIRANEAACVRCESQELLDYESRDNGTQRAFCQDCGAHWTEFSDPADQDETPKVFEVELGD